MHKQPTYLAWKITSNSAGEAHESQHWLASRIDLDRVFTNTRRTAPDGVEQVQTEHHRLGDYFAAILILPDSEGNPMSLRLVFQRLPEAGRYWKDLMVNILQEIDSSDLDVSIGLESKGESELLASASIP